jgi:NarL family two-component system sensor histidine kinase YdfH
MEILSKRRDDFSSLPIYIFLSFLLGGIGVISARAAWQANTPGLAILGAVLIIIHISLYWFNLRPIINPRWWFFYYIAQTVLIIWLAFLPNGLTFLGSATISIAAEAMGLWGNTRRAFSAVVFYTTTMMAIVFVLMDKSNLPAYLAQIMVTGGVIVLVMFFFNQQLAERHKAENLAETLESANAKLAVHVARIESLTLQAERERMARELHDTLAQGVAGLILRLEALKALQEQSNHVQAQSVLEQAIARARNTLGESRAAIENLRNDNMGFGEAVKAMFAQINNEGGVDFQLSMNLMDDQALPSNIQHHARRVLHEAAANVNKHSAATQAQISVEQSEKMLTLRIRDNGKGFDINEEYAPGRFGLQGLEERAHLTGSQYTLRSVVDKGTTIDFKFPLTENS